MQQDTTRDLRYISDIKRIPALSNYLIIGIWCWAILAFPAYIIYFDRVTSHEQHVGGVTRKLIHDYVKWEKLPHLAYSTWREQDSYTNGSAYHQSFFIDPQLVILTVSVYRWKDTNHLVSSLMVYAFQFSYFMIRILKERYGWKRILLFVFVSFLLHFLLILGELSSVELLLAVIKTSVIDWLDSQIYDSTGYPVIFSTVERHPLTSGKFAPFELFKFYRYLREDVVFKCDYLVFSLNDAVAIFNKPLWRKNGLPLIFNERIYVNVSIKPVLRISGVHTMTQYSVISTLTIEVIDEFDFGGYTCDLYNPMRISVAPGPTMRKGYKKSTSETDDILDSTCNCRPRGGPFQEKEFKKDKQSDRADTSMLSYSTSFRATAMETWGADVFQCFAEFRLIRRSDTSIQVSLNPGSIFIDGAEYISTADEADLEFDVTFSTDDTSRENCCSKLIVFYWQLFRNGLADYPPFTRLVIDGELKYFYRYQCMCPSSFGSTQFTLTRNYFNHTTGSCDRIDIFYPRVIRLLPTISHPWSPANAAEDSKLDDMTPTQTSTSSFLVGAFDTILFFDEFFLYVLIFVSALICIDIIPIALSYYCVRPILDACLTYGSQDTTLEAVKGGPITYSRPYYEHRRTALTPDNINYEVILSYDDNHEFDLMMAQSIKGCLLTLNTAVFDLNSDISPGQPILHAIGEAIGKSYRFGVIASRNYLDDNLKVMEFESIQQAIVSQNSKLKDRLIVIQTQQCDIEVHCQMPCIRIPEFCRRGDAIDQASLFQFLNWERVTRPACMCAPPKEYYKRAMTSSILIKQTVAILVVGIFTVLAVDGVVGFSVISHFRN